MHCELLVPALLAQAERASAPTPALEMLLGRGRRASGEACSTERWLVARFSDEAAPLAAGALTMIGSGRDAERAFWVRADPVHLQLGRDDLTLVPGEALAIRPEEAEALCASLSAHFCGTFELSAASPQRWCARLNAAQAFSEVPALEVIGAGVDERLQSGEVPAAWHGILNEAQMLLHAHPVNEAREVRGERTINSLWLWGGGSAPVAAHSPWSSVNATEPVALGLAHLTGKRALSASSAAEWLHHLSEDGRQLCVLDSLRIPTAFADGAARGEALSRLERNWFAPLLDALRAGRIGMISVHVPDAAECTAFETVRSDLRRFWRRARPLSSYITSAA